LQRVADYYIPLNFQTPSYPSFKKAQLLEIMEHEYNRKQHHQYLNIHPHAPFLAVLTFYNC